ncbi:DUF429 domain-containing protein [Angustibacter aerolatus]
MRAVAGVDGVRERWVAALVADDGAVRWRAGLDADHVVALLAEVAVVGLDCPIGLVDGDPRAADVEAKTLLAAAGSGGSSVFPTPPLAAYRAAVAASRRASGGSLHPHRVVAQEASRAGGGPGIATQTWGLADKVVSVERALLVGPPDAAERVAEVHPECSFAAMGGPGPLRRKRSAVGVAQRVQRLTAALHLDVLAALADDALLGVPVDDALDALAAAWSARRLAAGTARVLGRQLGGCATDVRRTVPARIVV